MKDLKTELMTVSVMSYHAGYRAAYSKVTDGSQPPLGEITKQLSSELLSSEFYTAILKIAKEFGDASSTLTAALTAASWMYAEACDFAGRGEDIRKADVADIVARLNLEVLDSE